MIARTQKHKRFLFSFHREWIHFNLNVSAILNPPTGYYVRLYKDNLCSSTHMLIKCQQPWGKLKLVEAELVEYKETALFMKFVWVYMYA